MATVTHLLSYRLQQLHSKGASPQELAEAAKTLLEAQRAAITSGDHPEVIALRPNGKHLFRVM